MSLTIDYLTKVISVPKADLTLIQSNPTEIRELNLVAFHNELRDWEDNDGGMVMPVTHNYASGTEVGGVTLAAVISLINGYTVTFEDGQYAVNLTGANSNVGDNVNVNQVSVRSANSAGLVQTREIQYASFQDGVTIDVTSSFSGTSYPIGTRRAPVNNLSDAMLIADLYGFNNIYVLGNLTIDNSGGSYQGMSFIGESKNKTTITIEAAAEVSKCEFYDAHVDGTLDGESVLRGCVIDNLNYVSGYVEQCVIAPGTISLGGSTTAHFLDCYSGVPGTGTPTIDMGGDGPGLAMRNYNGGIALTNKSGTAAVSIDLNSGQVVLNNTVTAGTIVIRGIGKLTNSGATASVNAKDLVQGSKLLTVARFLGLK